MEVLSILKEKAWDPFWGLEQKMESLGSKMKVLISRRDDRMAETKHAELHSRKRRRTEIDNWFCSVQKLEHDFQCLEQEVQQSSKSSRIGLSYLADKILKELEDLLEQGKFSEGIFLNENEEKLQLLEFEQSLREVLVSLSEVSSVGIYGMGGASVSGNTVAVFKPLNEEPNAVNYAGEGIKEESLGRVVAVTPEGLRKGTKAGKGGYREVAAYSLDHPKSGRLSDSGNKDMMQLKHEIQKVYTVYRPVSSADESTVSERHLGDLIPEIKKMIVSTTAGLKEGKSPDSTGGGAGGSYYMRGASGNRVAVFKPLNEEYNAGNYAGEGIKEESLERAVAVTPEGSRMGTKAGKGGYREVAAYILDHPKSGPRSESGEKFGFAGVPPTAFVTCYRREGVDGLITAKLGSLQMYIDNPASCSLIGPDVYNEFPLHEVHKIAVLDIRFANADRHGGNILRSKFLPAVLTPIDHGYCFPASFGGGRLVWLDWPQAEKPFSDETIKYIRTLNAQEDIDLLKSYGWVLPLAVDRVFRTSTMLLKEGAEKGLTPYAIGKIMCRSKKDEECEIEKIFNEASQKFPLKEDDSKFIEAVSAKIDSHLGNIAVRCLDDTLCLQTFISKRLILT